MTQTQFLAADPASSVWLAAHAGTGKTKVLVDRVLRLLLAGEAISSLLCLTYTKAAAMEMQERIRAVLKDWPQMDDAALSKRLAQLLGREAQAVETARARRLFYEILDHPQGLRIQTIHAFCQSLLSAFPLEAGLPAHFTVMDDVQSAGLLSEAANRLLMLHVQEEHREGVSSALAEIASQSGDSAVEGIIAAIVDDHALLLSQLAPEGGRQALMDRIAAGLDIGSDEPDVSAWLRIHADDLRGAGKAWLRGTKPQQPVAQALLSALEQPENEMNVDALIASCLTKNGEPRADSLFTLKDAPEHTSTLMRLRDQVARHQCGKVARYSQAVVRMADALLSIYRRLKQQRGWQDYDDLIMAAIRLLSDDETRGFLMHWIGSRICHLLIDEAQDTSRAQWTVIEPLLQELFQPDMAGRGRSLFVVGDLKQSIFRFQGASPEMFAAQADRYEEWFTSAGLAFRRLTLDTSFRSSSAVLEAVDALCRLPKMRESIGDFEEGHRPHRSQDAGRVELWPLLCVPRPDVPKAWEVTSPAYAQPDAASQLASQVADTIAAWLQEGRMLPSRGRAVAPGDIMLLVRTRGALAKALMRSLHARGVPVAGADRIALTEHLAVQDMLAIARWCLLPQDDLTLACILKGPLCGMSEETLFALAHGRGDASLHNALRQTEPHHATMLDTIRELSRSLSPYVFFVSLLTQFDLRRRLRARLSDEADDVLAEFLSLVEGMGEQDLQQVTEQIAHHAGTIKRDMESGHNAVRIMTVHGAKGLQAPIVLLPDTTGRPNLDGTLWWHRGQDGLACYAVPPGMTAPPQLQAIKDAKRRADYEEYLRLLYVAMTRAEDELYIMGASSSDKLREGVWYEMAQQLFDALQVKPDADEKRILSCQQLRGVVAIDSVAAPEPSPLPAWVGQSPPAETTAPVLRASHAAQGTAASLSRGVLLHRLLEWMPTPIPAIEDIIAAARFWSDVKDIESVAQEALRIRSREDLQWLFAAGSRAEVALAARTKDGRAISGQIDRLIDDGVCLHIVDYKTDRAASADDRTAYMYQLAVYRWLVASLFPEREIRCYLLWTVDGRLELVDTELLDNAGLRLDSQAA